ncbi:MAG: hypothetical protein ACREBE_15620, partial [bacterium]
GSDGPCGYPGASLSNVRYTVPTNFPAGVAGALHKVRVVVTDQAGNSTTVTGATPFHIVAANPDAVRTLLLMNPARMQSRMGISGAQAAAVASRLQELSSHPRVQGVVVDVGASADVTELLLAWDGDPGNSDRANAALFGCHVPFPAGCLTDRERNGIHDLVLAYLSTYGSVKHLVIAGDDRILPLARIADGTGILPESAYAGSADLSATGSTVGRALFANRYLSDDPLGVLDPLRSNELSARLYLPDLAVGRLVESPDEIATTVETFIAQDGVLDLSALDPATGHKVLVDGYDFLGDSAREVRRRWKSAFSVSTPDGAIAPVDGGLVGTTWGLPNASARAAALFTHLGGNAGARYGVMSLNGHGTHYREGVPGTSALDIQGLASADLYGPDGCGTPSLGPLDLAGGVIYALGAHGGLPVPGSCATDADHSLDLPQTFLSRGALAYVANTGYGWGLKHGIGYGERLSLLVTGELTRGGTVTFGDALRRSKQRYYLETPRFDRYDEKSLMQWTLFGLPMYAVKTGIPMQPGAAHESTARPASTDLLPAFLTQLNLQFDLSAAGTYVKHDAQGNDATVVPALANPGCPDPLGCYYTLAGEVARSTGAGDLP